MFRRLRVAGVPMCFLTNTTSRTRRAIVRALGPAGFDVGGDEVSTATAATADLLARDHPGARCLLLDSGDVSADLARATLVGPVTGAMSTSSILATPGPSSAVPVASWKP